VYKFVSIKKYILFKLFGEFFIDYGDASATACFNIHTFRWDSHILSNVLDVKKGKFGEPVDCTFVLKGMKKEYAKVMGPREDIPVAVGSGDGMLANAGCGVYDDTSMSCTIGTSGALRIATNKPLLDEFQRTWCYCFTKDTWVAGGARHHPLVPRMLQWLRLVPSAI
jgi:gluconokinase